MRYSCWKRKDEIDAQQAGFARRLLDLEKLFDNTPDHVEWARVEQVRQQIHRIAQRAGVKKASDTFVHRYFYIGQPATPPPQKVPRIWERARVPGSEQQHF